MVRIRRGVRVRFGYDGSYVMEKLKGVRFRRYLLIFKESIFMHFTSIHLFSIIIFYFDRIQFALLSSLFDFVRILIRI